MGDAGADMSRPASTLRYLRHIRATLLVRSSGSLMPRAVDRRRMADGRLSLRRGPFRRQLSIVTVVSPSEVPELEDRVRVRRAQAASRYNVIVQRYSRIVGWRFACWSQRAANMPISLAHPMTCLAILEHPG